MDSEASTLDSEMDWQAIDIFVFSNGQQYSPPRKYHIRAEDLNLWKSTLSFLAKMQYGPYHSTIDLYTIQGRKIVDPFQLSNGGSYVAVQPPDCFIEAGYEKYLLKASRSFEKRRAKRNLEGLEPDDSKNLLNMENIEENIECDKIELMKETVILNSRVPSPTNIDASTLIKPQLQPAPQRKSALLYPAKLTGRKRPSIQSPNFVRKNAPSLLPVPNTNKSISFKKDLIKPTLKIPKLEERNIPSKVTPRYSKTIRPSSRSKDLPKRSESIQPNIQNEKTYPFKVTSAKNAETLSTNRTDLKDVIEGKKMVLNSDLYQNTFSEMPAISVKPILIQSILYDPATQQGTTADAENSKHISIGANNSVPENNESIHIGEVIESINIDHNMIENIALESISAEKLKLDQLQSNVTLKQNVEENLFDNNVNDNIRIQDSPPRRRSIKVELPDDQIKEKYIGNEGNETTASTRKISDPIKVFKPSSSRSSTRVLENRVLAQYVAQKIEEVRDLSPIETDKSLNDRYKATLKKGDVVNLKLNIEIENHDGNPTKLNENLYSQSVTIIDTDKGSQSNIEEHIIEQSKSLSSLITKQLNNHHGGDNHRVVIVQYNYCKYCNQYNAPKPDQEPNKKYFILLPIEKFEEITEDNRCRCGAARPEIQISSIINYPKTTYSFTSLPKGSAETAAQNASATSDTKSENVTAVSRKKSVAIYEESTLNTREPAKVVQEVDANMKFIPVRMESVGIVHSIEMKNSSTQTEWCDILLEARLLCDGHYAFRLPPLELLKYYNLT